MMYLIDLLWFTRGIIHHSPIMASITRTEHFPSLIDADTATFAFEHLRDAIEWEEGIRSKHGRTRLAKSLGMDDDEVVYGIVSSALDKMVGGKNNMKAVAIFGIYLNRYRTGDDYTPAHSHKGTAQIIISLGGTRTLTIGKKSYSMANGDAAIFGGSVHGVPKEKTNEERISIALFCKML